MSWYKKANFFEDTENQMWLDYLMKRFKKPGNAKQFPEDVIKVLFLKPQIFKQMFEESVYSDEEGELRSVIANIVENQVIQSLGPIFNILSSAMISRKEFVSNEVETEKVITEKSERDAFIKKAKDIFDQYNDLLESIYDFVKKHFNKHEILGLYVKGNYADFMLKIGTHEIKMLKKSILDLFPYEITKFMEYLGILKIVEKGCDDYRKALNALNTKAKTLINKHDNLTYKDKTPKYYEEIIEKNKADYIKKEIKNYIETPYKKEYL